MGPDQHGKLGYRGILLTMGAALYLHGLTLEKKGLDHEHKDLQRLELGLNTRIAATIGAASSEATHISSEIESLIKKRADIASRMKDIDDVRDRYLMARSSDVVYHPPEGIARISDFCRSFPPIHLAGITIAEAESFCSAIAPPAVEAAGSAAVVSEAAAAALSTSFGIESFGSNNDEYDDLMFIYGLASADSKGGEADEKDKGVAPGKTL